MGRNGETGEVVGLGDEGGIRKEEKEEEVDEGGKRGGV